ncbi:Dynein heavy chain, cytoplasmic [Dirofilaria immitis]
MADSLLPFFSSNRFVFRVCQFVRHPSHIKRFGLFRSLTPNETNRQQQSRFKIQISSGLSGTLLVIASQTANGRQSPFSLALNTTTDSLVMM